MKNHETVGDYLFRLRSENFLSQLDLETDSGVSRKHISAIENGRVLPDYERILKLSKALKVPPSTFLEKIGTQLDKRYKARDFPS